MSGKGSKPRPYSVDSDTLASNWERTFGKKKNEDNTGTDKNEYYDVLSTEEALDKLSQINQELGLYYETDTPENNPLIKK